MSFAMQPGQQTKFGSSPADICIYGGAAGGGKSFGLLLESARNLHVKNYSGILFRRKSVDLRDGGLWDESQDFFNALGVKTNERLMRVNYPEGGFIKMSHLQYEKDVLNHQGKQYAFQGWDELTQFSEKQFFYLQTRNRSMVVRPYTRGTCNPDPDSFLVNGKTGWGSGLISWWIGEDGYPIAERDSKVRYMYRMGDSYDWANSPERLIDRHYDTLKELYDRANARRKVLSWDRCCRAAIKSVSFVGSNVYDNEKLIEANPEYLAELNTQDTVTRERLLKGNWKVKQEGTIFKREHFAYYEDVPHLDNIMIFADTAQSTKETAAYTVFLLVGYNENGLYILDIVRGRFDVDELLEEAVKFWRRHQKYVFTNRPPAVMRIENKSSGIGLNQQLRKARIPIDPVERGGKTEKGEKAPGSKWERAVNSVYALNGRKVYLPSRPTPYAPSVAWVSAFETELLGAEKHGDGKGYWDQIDTFSDAVAQFYIANDSAWVM